MKQCLLQAASEPICTLKGHTGSVTCLSALYLDMENDSESRETLIVSASIDSTVRIWSRKSLGNYFKICIVLIYTVISAE